ncbi:MAG: amino acid permease [Acidobacteria bacterium]|nr:amino acid permease [Acidobacteriota bacterium]
MPSQHEVARRRDQEDLSRFGYAQELFRSMGGFSNFAISFSIISILTGAVTLYGYGLEMGGPLEMSLGWPLATLFTLTVAASLAEMCSAYPTSGAMYHWAADLGGPVWGWFTAWLNIFGSIAALAGINYSCAQFILPFLDLSLTPGHLFAMLAFILLTQAVLNHYSVRLVAWLNDGSVAVHIVGVIVVVGALLWFAPQKPVSFLFEATSSNGRSPYWWAFLLGLLQAQWTFTGFDASAHMAEETEDPRRRAPWGIVLSVGVSGVVGFLLLMALTLAIPDIRGVLSAKDASGNPVPAAIAILQSGLGQKAGNAVAALASMAMWFCGLATITSASRTLYSLARDHGAPASGWLRGVHARHGTPGPAIWVTTLAAMAAMAWSGAIPVVTSLSTVALYVAYLIPIALSLGRENWRSQAVWNLGRYGRLVNLAAIGYTVLVCVVLVMPPNELAGYTFLALVCFLGVLYRVEARKKYTGPEWATRGSTR